MSTTTTAQRGVWHNLPPKLAGWRMIDQAHDGTVRLIGPDGWETKGSHRTSTTAIAEALRRVNSLPAAGAALAVTSDVHVGVPMMDKAEAREIVSRIKSRIEEARRDLLDLKDREGWKALGYDSWGACARAEFGSSAATLYRQLEAAEIERDVRGDSQLENLPPIPTTQLQAVKHLEPSDRKVAFDRADQLAGTSLRTTQHVQQAAAEIVAPTMHPDYQHMAAVEQLLTAAADKGERTGTAMYQEAYSHARQIRDRTLHDRAFALIDAAVDGTPAVQPAPSFRLGPGQPPPAPWPEPPAGWRWNRRGAPAHLIAADGWTTNNYNDPQRAIAEAQQHMADQRVPTTAESRDADGPWFWASKSAVHPTAHCWHRSPATAGYVSACGIELPAQPTQGGKGIHCSVCETHADRRTIVAMPGTTPPAQLATAHTRPRPPVSADSSALFTYVEQCEDYMTAIERRIPTTPQAALDLAVVLIDGALDDYADQLTDAHYEALARLIRSENAISAL